MAKPDYGTSIFINCPFDSAYSPLLEAILFAVVSCGFRPRCALEVEDSSQVRMEKILKIISQCRFGIHDLSRTDLDGESKLPRFNMPLELGIFLGAKSFGRGEQRQKVGLILDREKYRYQTFISDLGGQDIRAHGNDPKKAIAVVRDWLRSSSHRLDIPGGKALGESYDLFLSRRLELCQLLRLSEEELTFPDSIWIISEWIRANTPG
ncbi:MAG TPA: hypothetical protein VH988_30375 [Thermoanaerobaculia bacterium]|jgi:hypothetical protein|nr:hypothetical protein [Thermoanaerobaculia bacterium]